MKEAVLTDQISGWRGRAVDYFALEHNVTIASAAVFLIGFGEELWKKFLPKYLEALGATTPIIGLFGTAGDFFDACYQYPGGFVADRFGRRRAFLIFITLASLGYVVYLFSTSWPFLFVGLALVMAWQSMASPAIFAVIGDSLPRERRAMGFTLQSILKRVPIVIAPIVGGTLIASMGLVNGVHIGLLITLALAAVTLVLVLKIRTSNQPPHSTNIRGVWRSFHGVLKRLLISDIIIRTCEGMTGCVGDSLCDQHSRHQCRGLRHSYRHSDDHVDPCLHSGRKDCRSNRTQAFCDSDIFEFCAVSRRNYFRLKFCLVDRRLCDRRSARDWRAFKKSDDRGSCARQHSREICRALLSRSQSFDHAGGRDWWIALEDCAASAVRYCRIDRTGWNRGVHHDCRGTLCQLGTQDDELWDTHPDPT